MLTLSSGSASASAESVVLSLSFALVVVALRRRGLAEVFVEDFSMRVTKDLERSRRRDFLRGWEEGRAEGPSAAAAGVGLLVGFLERMLARPWGG